MNNIFKIMLAFMLNFSFGAVEVSGLIAKGYKLDFTNQVVDLMGYNPEGLNYYVVAQKDEERFVIQIRGVVKYEKFKERDSDFISSKFAQYWENRATSDWENRPAYGKLDYLEDGTREYPKFWGEKLEYPEPKSKHKIHWLRRS